MADTTRLAGEVVDRGERKPSPRLRGKMLEGVPERAGKRGIEEVRSLARGMPTEFATADGEKVTLVMRGPRMTPQEKREWDARADALIFDMKMDIIGRLHGMPRDVRNEAIAALCGTDPLQDRLMINIAPCYYDLSEFPARPPTILIEKSTE